MRIAESIRFFEAPTRPTYRTICEGKYRNFLGYALKVMEDKGYSKTDSWIKNGYYFVRNAGKELKQLLMPYRMESDRWRERVPAAG
jgi:hypothetical protein